MAGRAAPEAAFQRDPRRSISGAPPGRSEVSGLSGGTKGPDDGSARYDPGSASIFAAAQTGLGGPIAREILRARDLYLTVLGILDARPDDARVRKARALREESFDP